jgi:hypothetical protein
MIVNLLLVLADGAVGAPLRAGQGGDQHPAAAAAGDRLLRPGSTWSMFS